MTCVWTEMTPLRVNRQSPVWLPQLKRCRPGQTIMTLVVRKSRVSIPKAKQKSPIDEAALAALEEELQSAEADERRQATRVPERQTRTMHLWRRILVPTWMRNLNLRALRRVPL